MYNAVLMEMVAIISVQSLTHVPPSIIELDTGSQPIANETDSVHLICGVNTAIVLSCGRNWSILATNLRQAPV